MKNWFTYVRIHFCIQTNAFLYYLTKLPMIGILIPPNAFRYKVPKIFVSIFGYTLDFVKKALPANLSTLVLMYYIPQVFLQLFGRPEAANKAVYAFYFIMNCCLLTAARQSNLLKPTRDDLLFLNHFMVNPQTWYRQKMIDNLWRNVMMVGPALAYVFRDAYFVCCLICVHLAASTASDIVYLTLFRKAIKLPERKKRALACNICALVLYGACFVLRFPDTAVPAWGFILFSVVMLALCVLFCVRLYKFQNYKAIAVEYASANKPIWLVKTITSAESDAFYLAESDPEEYTAQFRKFESLGAWDYFERTLKLRLAKAFRNYRKQTVLIDTVLALIAGLLFRCRVFGLQAQDILNYSSFAITTVIGMSWSHSFLELCFRNMDAPLLYHHFYDAPTIRQSILKRFRYLMRNGIFLLGLAIADILILLLAAGTWLPTGKLLMIVAVFALLLFVFETLHLAVYYILQPYTTDFTVKNPVFTAFNTVEGFLIYGILLIRGDMTNLLIPLMVLAVFVSGFLLTALHLAPHTFRIRS